MTFRGFLDNLLIYGLEYFGKYYSSYRSYVVDKNDPDKLGRIKVKIPVITGDVTHPKWIFPKGNFSGKDYGLQVLPNKGDMVWVEFESGNANFPMWSHGHYGNDEKPEEFDSVNIYGFKTPEGHIVLLDDDGGRVLIKSTDIIQLNDGENEGLVIVQPLVDKINRLEDKVNDFLTDYQAHSVIDPISGVAGPLFGIAPLQIIPKTKKSDLENTKVTH